MTDTGLTAMLTFWNFIWWLGIGVGAAYGLLVLFVWFSNRNGSN